MAVDMCLEGLLPSTTMCRLCGTEHEDEAHAATCCRGRGIPVHGFSCPICGALYRAESVAITCCDWQATPAGIMATIRALESAGQLALELEGIEQERAA